MNTKYLYSDNNSIKPANLNALADKIQDIYPELVCVLVSFGERTGVVRSLQIGRSYEERRGASGENTE